MFKVIDKEKGKIRTIYATKIVNGEEKFLYYHAPTQQWKWCFASWFKPMELDDLCPEDYC